MKSDDEPLYFIGSAILDGEYTVTDEDVLLTERKGDVLLLTMNRLRRHHALNRALSGQLADAVVTAEKDGINCIVLTGAGDKAFCAGADMLEASGVEKPADDDDRISAFDSIGAFSQTPIPTIAAINGYCYGGGARLAIGCDILFASDNATFRLPGSEYGLVVGAVTLPRLVGSSKAKELIFSARKFTASDALSWGMLSAVYSQSELLKEALQLADEIANNSISAVRESKRVIDMATLSSEANRLEEEANKTLRGSDEQVARFRSATKKVTGR